MAGQSQSAEEVVGLGKDHDLQITRPPLIGESPIAKEPIARFGENYLTTFPRSDGDTVMTGINTVVEAEEEEEDGDGVDVAAGQYIIREAIRKLRECRREGYEDKLRVQRKIGRRKVKSIRQRMKKDKHQAEENVEEYRRGECKLPLQSPTSSQTSKPAQEYIAPSCVTTSHRVSMVAAPPSPSLAGTAFATSARTLLAQLKEIELHPPMLLPEADEAMSSPIASPALPSVGDEKAMKPDRESIHGHYMKLMDYSNTSRQPTQYPELSPYEMRDGSYPQLSESPSP